MSQPQVLEGALVCAALDDLDLAAGGVAVPEPIAAWSIAGPQSPYVIAFLAPSYEGLNVRIAIVEAERVRELTDGIYLYRCAF